MAERLIEEHRDLGKPDADSAFVAKKGCQICGRDNHSIDKCFLNPFYSGNRLGLTKKVRPEPSGDDKHSKGKTHCAHKTGTGKGKRKVKGTERSAMARSSPTETDWMLLDSGTSSHMTELMGKVNDWSSCSVPISLEDGSTVAATVQGKRFAT